MQTIRHVFWCGYSPLIWMGFCFGFMAGTSDLYLQLAGLFFLVIFVFKFFSILREWGRMGNGDVFE